jgi:uncharacterized protein
MAGLGSAAAIAYMVFESQWVRRVERTVAVPGLPEALHGFTVAHLSDCHVGFQPSLNARAARKAFALAMAARPDLIVITGDLADSAGGLSTLETLLDGLSAPFGVFAVMGNHDHGISKVPMATAVDLSQVHRHGVRLLVNEVVTVTRGDARVQV